MRSAEPTLTYPAGATTVARAGARLANLLPAILLYTATGVFGALIAYRFPWNGDTGLHVATIEQLSHHLTHPPDPLVGTATPSPYYSPLTLAQALLARLTGLDGLGVLRVTAFVNSLLLATGIHHFVRRLSPARWAPLFALLAIVLLQGTTLLTWSGFLGLTSLALTLSYPSTFALGVTLHLWGLVSWKLQGGHGWWAYPLTGLLGADIVLDHQFTAIGAGLGCLALLVTHARRLNRRHLVRWSVAAALVVVLVSLWPYYSIFSLLGSADGLDAIHRPLYHNVFGVYGLGLLAGIPVLAVRLRRYRLDPLVLLFLFAALLVGYGVVSGHYAWARAWPMVLLAGQLAVGVELGALAERHRRAERPDPQLRVFAASAAAVAMVMGLWTQLGTFSYFFPLPTVISHQVRIKKSWGTYSWMTHWVHPGQTILTDTYHGLRMAPAHRVFTVMPAYPEPWVPSYHQRRADNAAMMDPATPPATRAALLREYRVTWLITYPSHARALRRAGVQLTTVAHSSRFPRDGLYRIHLPAR